MLNDIYNPKILEFAGNIPRLGRLDQPDATATAHSRLCGSTVMVGLRMSEGRVVDFAQDVKACALGQAAASIVGRHVLGATAQDLRTVRDAVRAMLKENGSPPQGEWADVAILETVRDYRVRHASTLLAFEAAAQAASDAESGARSP